MQSDREALQTALALRGYCQMSNGVPVGWTGWGIGRDAPRRLSDFGTRVFVQAGAVRWGRHWAGAKPMPRATRATLVAEGRAFEARTGALIAVECAEAMGL